MIAQGGIFMKKGIIAYFKTGLYSGLYLLINMLAIIGTTVYLCFYNDDFYKIMYDVFMLNGEYSQLYNLIAYLVAPTTIITGIVIILIYFKTSAPLGAILIFFEKIDKTLNNPRICNTFVTLRVLQ